MLVVVGDSFSSRVLLQLGVEGSEQIVVDEGGGQVHQLGIGVDGSDYLHLASCAAASSGGLNFSLSDRSSLVLLTNLKRALQRSRMANL